MKTVAKRGLALAAVVGTGIVARRVAERAAADRLRKVVDTELDPLLLLPDGVQRHDIATHDGGNVHVVQYGTGHRTLVLVHGVTLAAEVWSPLLHLLADDFTILALDVRGHGASVVGADGVGRRHAARDLATVLDHFEVRDGIVMGHSMGGMILGELCGAHPDVVHSRLAGLAFMNTAVSELVLPALSAPVLAVGGRLRARVEAGKRMPRTIGDNDRSLVMSRVAFGARPSGAAIEQVRRLGAAVDERYYLPLWVDLPALVMVGSRDLLTPVSHARRIVRHLRRGELHVIPGAGHQLMQERPREVAELLQKFAASL